MRFLPFMLFAILLALLIIAVPVEAKTLYNKWMHDHTDFSVGGNNYTIITNWPDTDVVIFNRQDGFRFVVPKFGCRVQENEQFCFENTSNESDKTTIDLAGRYQLGLKVVVYEYVPVVTISKKYSSSALLLNRDYSVAIIIKNNGNTQAENVIVKDTLPTDFSIVQLPSGMVRDGRIITWQGSLGIGQERTLNYTITPISIGNGSTRPSIAYTYLGERKEVNASELKYKIINPIEHFRKLTRTFSKNNIEPDGSSTYTIKIENDEGSSIRVEGVVIIPSDIDSLTRTHAVQRDGDNYYFNATIADGEQQSYEFFLQPLSISDTNITTYVYYQMKDSQTNREYVYSERVGDVLKLNVKAVVPSLSVLPIAEQNLEAIPTGKAARAPRPGEDVQIFSRLENKNAQSSALSVQALISSPFFSIPLNYTQLISGETISAAFRKNIPRDYNGSHLVVSLNGTYSFSTGETRNFSVVKTIKLNLTQLAPPLENGTTDAEGVVNDTNASVANMTTTTNMTNVSAGGTTGVIPTPPDSKDPAQKKSGINRFFDSIAKFFENLF